MKNDFAKKWAKKRKAIVTMGKKAYFENMIDDLYLRSANGGCQFTHFA
ncbi:hypothetical protein [uncultured Shewanella sp.]|nr:hypothetical protein [uncultured Shewanella sp.]